MACVKMGTSPPALINNLGRTPQVIGMVLDLTHAPLLDKAVGLARTRPLVRVHLAKVGRAH